MTDLLRCEKCGAQMALEDGASETLVGYRRFTDEKGDHEHDDNCIRREAECPYCGSYRLLSVRRRCNLAACDWRGKAECQTCGVPKFDEWPDAAEFEKRRASW